MYPSCQTHSYITKVAGGRQGTDYPQTRGWVTLRPRCSGSKGWARPWGISRLFLTGLKSDLYANLARSGFQNGQREALLTAKNKKKLKNWQEEAQMTELLSRRSCTVGPRASFLRLGTWRPCSGSGESRAGHAPRRGARARLSWAPLQGCLSFPFGGETPSRVRWRVRRDLISGRGASVLMGWELG